MADLLRRNRILVMVGVIVYMTILFAVGSEALKQVSAHSRETRQ